MTFDGVRDVTTHTIDALKQQPLLLAMVLFQTLTLGAVLYSSHDRQKANSAQFERSHALLQKCMERS